MSLSFKVMTHLTAPFLSRIAHHRSAPFSTSCPAISDSRGGSSSSALSGADVGDV